MIPCVQSSVISQRTKMLGAVVLIVTRFTGECLQSSEGTRGLDTHTQTQPESDQRAVRWSWPHSAPGKDTHGTKQTVHDMTETHTNTSGHAHGPMCFCLCVCMCVGVCLFFVCVWFFFCVCVLLVCVCVCVLCMCGVVCVYLLTRFSLFCVCLFAAFLCLRLFRVYSRD